MDGHRLPQAALYMLPMLLVTGGVLVAASDGAWKADQSLRGTIAFSSVGRAQFAFDIYCVEVPDSPDVAFHEAKLTDGVSVNYNGQFVEGEARLAVLDGLKTAGVEGPDSSSLLMFVSERNGSSQIYVNLYQNRTQKSAGFQKAIRQQEEVQGKRRETRELMSAYPKSDPVAVDAVLSADGPVYFDRPSVAGASIVYMSTSEASKSPRKSWAAVYSTSLTTRKTVRLTPKGIADFSPSISPSGEWIAAASNERRGFHGEKEELLTDIYVYKSQDGSHRRLLSVHGGWPSWADDHTIFFHRVVVDGWWSVFRITFPETFLSCGEGKVQEERITPPGLHAFTPAASPTGKWVAVATRRPNSLFRHIEIFDLTSKSFLKVTEKLSPTSNHYNPFISTDLGVVGYHRCRGNRDESLVIPVLEAIRSPWPDLAIFRVDGFFPSFSPDGSLLALIASDGSGVYVSSSNGAGQRKVFTGPTFGTAWDWKRKGVLYTSSGLMFQSLSETVNVVSVHNVHGNGELSWKQLTKSGNNAFPSPSPDGKYLVFRSGRSGYKNLYIMDAVDGEEKEIWQLTDGPWIDQHPTWSPGGEWIAFSSNREDPVLGVYSIYLIHPDGTGLHKVLHSGQAGLAVHPWFSPDGKKLLFASDLAAVSGEPVAVPHLFEPSGEIFVADIDGSNIQRLTHNVWEDSTPSWSSSFLSLENLSTEGNMLECDFDDTTWLASTTQMYSNFHHPDIGRLPPITC